MPGALPQFYPGSLRYTRHTPIDLPEVWHDTGRWEDRDVGRMMNKTIGLGILHTKPTTSNEAAAKGNLKGRLKI